ncbi:MAG: pilus assembly protein CpaE [Isosphaeraceae bacterium]|jgi:pilus assembly protein CpaE|nr:MAG: pilus assembly protein CpaE [Isosphaeraceae bacterium]
MDALRVVLIDPETLSREALQHLLQGLDTIWLTEVCPSYSAAPKAVADQQPHLVVLTLDHDPDHALALLAELSRAHPATAILPASSRPDSELILRSIRAGAREFLTLPPDPEELIAAIGRLVASGLGGSSRLGGRIVTVAGAAGGIGCTTLAVNLAAIAARDNARTVALADFDLLLGTTDACLDIVTDYTLTEVAQNADRLDLSLLKRSMARHASGVHLLPRPASMDDLARLEPETFRRVIALLRAAFGFVVIDTSKALHASDVIAWEMADLVLLVIQLELTCLRNTARLLQSVRQVDGLIEKIRVVVNRHDFRDCQIAPRKAEEALNLPVAWSLPDAHHEVALSRARGVPIGTAFPRSKIQKALEGLAHGVLSATGLVESSAKPQRRRLAAMF